MAKHKTPIERAIDGDPPTRQGRYLKRIREAGLIRTTVTIPAGRGDELRAICARWRDEARGDD